PAGSIHDPPTNTPNVPLCVASHSRAGRSLSGAGPYSIVSKIREMVAMGGSDHGMTVRRGVAPGDEVLELPLDVGQQAGCAEPESIGAQPAVAELFLHELQVLQRLPGRADAAGRLVADLVAGALRVLADHARHDQRHGQ